MNAGDLRIEAWENGAAFYVKAHPGSRREGVSGVHDGMIRVDVAAAPEKGKANKAIVKLLAKALGVPATALRLLSGDTSARKRFGLAGVSPEDLRERLEKLP